VFKNAANILEKIVMGIYPNSQSTKEVKDHQLSTIYMIGDNPKVDICGVLKVSLCFDTSNSSKKKNHYIQQLTVLGNCALLNMSC
jgi:hypothetical protein